MGIKIETCNLSKYYDDFLAVSELNIKVCAGEVMVLLGPNGAGKTTTIRLLASILKPSSGWARINGFDVLNDSVAVRHSLGVLTEHHGLYSRMKALEYLRFFGRSYGMHDDLIRKKSEELLAEFDLIHFINRRLGTYSKGMRQKLALVRAFLHDPEVLLLDEPTSAMDPASARQVRQIIKRLRSTQRAIIVCTHNLAEAEQVADRIAIIHSGKIVGAGTLTELLAKFQVQPIWELRVMDQIDAAILCLPVGSELLESGTNWVRFRQCNQTRPDGALLRNLIMNKIPVHSLAPINNQLENLYLRIISQVDMQDRKPVYE